MGGLLVLGDCLQVGIVQPVHQEAFIQQIEALVEAIAILLDEGADVYFELVGFATFDECQALSVALLGRRGTFCRNAL